MEGLFSLVTFFLSQQKESYPPAGAGPGSSASKAENPNRLGTQCA